MAKLYKKRLNKREAINCLKKAIVLKSNEAELELEKEMKSQTDYNSFNYKYFKKDLEVKSKFNYKGITKLSNTSELNLAYLNSSDKEFKLILDGLRKQVAEVYFRDNMIEVLDTEELLPLVKMDDKGDFTKQLVENFTTKLKMSGIMNPLYIKALEWIKKDLEDNLEALSALIGVIAELNLKDVPKELHDEIYNSLDEIIKSSEDTKIQFLAECTKQALVRVLNDESEFKSFFRRFTKFVERVIHLRGSFEEKDPSLLFDAFNCFKESLTFQDNVLLWYEELRYAQFLVMNKNLSILEVFLYDTTEETKKDYNFSLGVVYLMEEILKSMELSDLVKNGAINFIFDMLESELWGLSHKTKELIIYKIHTYKIYNINALKKFKNLCKKNNDIKNLVTKTINIDEIENNSNTE